MRRPAGGFQDPVHLRRIISQQHERITKLSSQRSYWKLQAKNYKRIAKARAG